jgi:Flp pilus assembly protein TadB
MHPLITVLAAVIIAVIAVVYLPSPIGWIVAVVALIVALAVVWNTSGAARRRP